MLKIENDAKDEIIFRAVALIESMRKEWRQMPVSWQAPKTVDAAGVLLSRLQDAGYNFPDYMAEEMEK